MATPYENYAELVAIALLQTQAALSNVSIVPKNKDTQANMDRIVCGANPQQPELMGLSMEQTKAWRIPTNIEIKLVTNDTALMATYAGAIQAISNYGTASGIPATLVTGLLASNNQIRYIAVTPGTSLITVAYVNAGASQSLSVTVVANAITVTLATNGASIITSTAAQVIAAINSSGPAAALVSANAVYGSAGTGLMTALAATPLTQEAITIAQTGFPGGWGMDDTPEGDRNNLENTRTRTKVFNFIVLAGL